MAEFAAWNEDRARVVISEKAGLEGAALPMRHSLQPSFAGVSYDKLEQGAVQWPCNGAAPDGTPILHINGFVRGKGNFVVTEYVATDEKIGPRFPLLLITGRILSNTTLARRPDAPRTSSGTRKTSWKSTRTMPRNAACGMATGFVRKAAPARRHCEPR